MTRARRIALVDADCDAQQELSRALTARGWTVSVHSTIREATEGLLAAPPDLMIVEVQLPDGLGLNLIDIVRGDDGAHIPSIVVSHRATEQDVMRGFAAGAVDYVSKPVRLPELIARCRVHLTRLSETDAPSVKTPDVPLIEGLAFGRYRIIREVGRGGYGVVYLADDPGERRLVALKVCSPPSTAEDEDQGRARFIRESFTLSTVQSPHVVRTFDTGEVRGRLYYAMDYVGGPSLERRTDAEGPMSEADVRQVARGLLQALVALESVGLVHRDIKPSNVVLRDGRVDVPVLVDFGLAKQQCDRDLSRSSGSILVGTPAYLPPEVIAGAEHEKRGDLWSLGMTLRFAITGEDVHPHLNGYKLLRAIEATEVEPPTAPMSPGFAQFLQALCQREPHRRPPDARAALAMLEAVCDGATPSTDRAPRPVRRRRALVGAGVATQPARQE